MNAIRIRAAQVDDAPKLAEIAGQPSVVWGSLLVPAHTPEQWRKRLEMYNADTSYVLVAEVDGAVAGQLTLVWSNRPRTRHVAQLGMMVHEAYQGQGVGKALMSAAVEAADKWLNVLRIELEVYPDNERAIRLYERSGFMHEGRKRLNSWRDGQYADALVMARIRPN